MFLLQHPQLRKPQTYRFEPYGTDSVKGISRDHGAEIFLDKDARKWAIKLTKDQASIASNSKQIKGLQTVTTAYAKVGGSGGYRVVAWREQDVHTHPRYCKLFSGNGGVFLKVPIKNHDFGLFENFKEYCQYKMFWGVEGFDVNVAEVTEQVIITCCTKSNKFN